MREHYTSEKQQQRAEIAELTEQYFAAGGTVEQYQYLCKSDAFGPNGKFNEFAIQSHRNKSRNGE